MQSKNWENKCLGEISTIKSGGTPSRTKKEYWNGDIPWVKISDISKEYVDKTDEFITDEGLKNSSTNIFPKGTILFTIFATIGKVGILDIDATTNQAIAGITPNQKIVNSKFLTYSLKELALSLENQGKGVAQKNINLSILKSTKIPLPPLPEQERIVAKLDSIFAHLEIAKQGLEKIPVLLKEFRQAVLTQAVTGKLTEGSNWDLKKMVEISTKITDGAHNTPKVLTDGFPYIMAKDLTSGSLDFGQGNYIGEKDHRELFNKCNPEKDDLLIVNIGAGTGNCVQVDVDFEFSFKNIAIVKPNRKLVVPRYLKLFLDSKKSGFINEFTKGGAQPFLSLKALKEIEINLPNEKEQAEIVRRVEALFSKADAIEAQYKKLKEQINQLPQAVLAKAFRGEI